MVNDVAILVGRMFIVRWILLVVRRVALSCELPSVIEYEYESKHRKPGN